MQEMDDMDCGQDSPTLNIPLNVPTSFVPKTELDYLLLGCLLESQQITPTTNSPNTLRAFSMYQRQFENHKMKSTQVGMERRNNGSNNITFAMPFPQTNMTSGQSMNGFNQFNTPHQKIPLQNYNGNQQNIQPNLKQYSPSRVGGNLQTQNVPPLDMLDMDEQLSPESKLKKEKKKPKRPNKVKPQGCEWCKVNSSPVWRGGPSGKGSLCNACGLQYMKGFTMERAKETLRKSRGEWKINSQM